MKMNPLIFIYICLLSISCDSTENNSEINEIEPTKELTTTTININQTIDGINVQRPVIIQTPENIDLSINYPVVFAFHGRGGTNTSWVNKLKSFTDIMGNSLEYILKAI